MPIRDATLEDVGTLCDMILAHAEHEGAAAKTTIDRSRLSDALFGPQPVIRALIAHLDPDPAIAVGAAIWYPTFSSWATTRGIWLEDLYVDPQHRRHGLGRELLMELRALTSGRIEWDVANDNEGAISFYASLGAYPLHAWTRFRWTLDPPP